MGEGSAVLLGVIPGLGPEDIAACGPCSQFYLKTVTPPTV